MTDRMDIYDMTVTMEGICVSIISTSVMDCRVCKFTCAYLYTMFIRSFVSRCLCVYIVWKMLVYGVGIGQKEFNQSPRQLEQCTKPMYIL